VRQPALVPETRRSEQADPNQQLLVDQAEPPTASAAAPAASSAQSRGHLGVLQNN
jgi:hypothetical protein